MASGGDDNSVRVFQLSKDFKSQEKKLELALASAPITSVDFSRENKYLVAGSKDGTAYVADLQQKGTVVQKLNFKPAPNLKNMIMRSCLFARDGSIYTLATQA